jgi:hypothetical protein
MKGSSSAGEFSISQTSSAILAELSDSALGNTHSREGVKTNAKAATNKAANPPTVSTATWATMEEVSHRMALVMSQLA